MQQQHQWYSRAFAVLLLYCYGNMEADGALGWAFG